MNRTISITGLYNIRDLGGLPNKYSKETVFGRYLRSDSLHTIDDNLLNGTVSLLWMHKYMVKVDYLKG